MPDLAEKTQRKIYSVSEINAAVRDLIEGHYNSLWVRGEISNFKAYPSGHFYFTLKDEKAQMPAVMFRGSNRSLQFRLENGIAVIVHGRLSLYEARGTFQILIDFVEPDGIGALQLAFDQLKRNLESEGLFDQGRKKHLPALPKRVGVITSESGAAVYDIFTVLKRRHPRVEILFYPVKVQGEGAKEEIASALHYFSEKKNVDVVIVGRGGGSLEDLWAFNEEIVARAIFACPLPVISAVGHETDFTIADFVSDLRAPTPSVAAELCVLNVREWETTLQTLTDSLQKKILKKIKVERDHIRTLVRLLPSPVVLWDRFRLHLANLEKNLIQNIKRFLSDQQHVYDNAVLRLKLLSPKNLLQRGYLIATRADGKVIKSLKEAKAGDALTLQMSDGRLGVEVKKIYAG